MRKLILFLKLPIRRKFLLIQAFFTAIYVVFLMRFLANKARFGKRQGSEIYFKINAITLVQDIRFSIRVVSKHIPFPFFCRHEAYLAKLLCQYHHIPFKIYVGVNKNESGIVSGHAWTLAGELMISGFCNPNDYQIIDCFYG